MTPIRPSNALDYREEPDMIDHGIATASIRPRVAPAAHDKRGSRRELASPNDAGANILRAGGSKRGLAPAMDAGACPPLRASPQAATHPVARPTARLPQQPLELLAFRRLDPIIVSVRPNHAC
jgi:hypothetical protein